MKQTQKSTFAELNGSKRQYEQPSIEVVELNIQTPLLAKSPDASNPDPGNVDIEDM